MIRNIVLKVNLLKNIVLFSKILKKTYKLNFSLTNSCNSKCLTCNTWRAYRQNPEKLKEELTTEEITKIFQGFSSLCWLALSGGEPYLRNDLACIIESAVKNCSRLNVISIASNGLDKNRIIAHIEKIIRIKRRPLLYLTFSIDGPEEIHDKIRGIKGAYGVVWETYKSVREITKKNNNIYLALESTISSSNAAYLIPFWKRLLADGHIVHANLAHKGYLYKNENNPDLIHGQDIGIIQEAVNFLSRRMVWNRPQEILEKIYLVKLKSYLEDIGKMIMPCVALKSSFAINPYGDVEPCFMWGKNLGNLRDHDYKIDRVLSLSETSDTQDLIKRGQCPVCWTPCEAMQAILEDILK